MDLQTYIYAIPPMSIKTISISFKLLSLAIERDEIGWCSTIAI